MLYYCVVKIWRKPFDYAEKAKIPGLVEIDKDRCKGCGFCVEYCPTKTLKMSTELSPKGYYLVMVDDASKCVACGFCEAVCPEFAVKVHTADKEGNGVTSS